MQQSEFGKGFVYNLILFSKHWWHHFEEMKRTTEMAAKYPDTWKAGELDLWFNGAGDHFFEFEIPPQFKNKSLGRLAAKLQKQALEYRMVHVTKEQFAQFFDDLERLARLIDKELGVKAIKSQRN